MPGVAATPRAVRPTGGESGPRQGRQSPIDIRTADVVTGSTTSTLVIDYPESVDLEVVYIRKDRTVPDGCGARHLEETIEALVPDGAASLSVDGRRFELLRFHFHTPSEHTVDGQSAPLEQHFVHMHQESEQLLVIGLFLHPGGDAPQHRAPQDQVLRNLPQECGESLALSGINLRRSLPDDLTSYNYEGSLTVEPFTDGVRWQVLQRAVRINAETIDGFKRMFPQGDARESQPLGGRTVRLFPDGSAEADRPSLRTHSAIR